MDNIEKVYKEALDDVSRGRMNKIKDAHLLASAAKAYFTDRMIEGIEICRRACGGHGFLDIARFHELYSEYAPMCTYEGENTVMYLAAA